MKRIKFLAAVVVLLGAVVLLAFVPTGRDKYSFGHRTAETLVCADTVDVDPGNLTFTYASMAMDTNVVVNVSIDRSITGDMIVFEFTADSTTRQIDWNSNITALNDSVVALKTKLFQFVYNGSAFVQLSEQQIN